MLPADKEPSTEREQTDASLRVEREQADHALEEQVAATDETADAVISRARERADAVLAAARAKTDRQVPLVPSSAESPKTVRRERVLEDQVLHRERAIADETLRDERAEHVALLSRERETTDHDLSSERARSDAAVATRDEFLGFVSHDLRNMLSAVIGFAEIIEKGLSEDDRLEPIRGYAQRIQRSGTRMSRLIGDLVDVASIEAGALAVTRESGDPAHIVTEAVETFQERASASGVSLVTEIGPLPRLATFDPARILQVLTNLLSNAIKFTPAHGKVVVRLERVEDDLRFEVSDTGVGIRRDQLETVFERFFQLAKNDRRGVGLGLYISKAIVQGHGGRIWAESTVGHGSTFRFTIPLLVGA